MATRPVWFIAEWVKDVPTNQTFAVGDRVLLDPGIKMEVVWVALETGPGKKPAYTYPERVTLAEVDRVQNPDLLKPS